MAIILLVLVLIAGVILAAFLYLKKDTNQSNEPSIDKIIERSVEIPEMTTNLSDDSYLVLSLKVQTDSKDAKVELEKRAFQVKNIIIQELSSMSSGDFKSKEGLIEVQNILKMRMNELMQNGTVEKVYITNRLIQG